MEINDRINQIIETTHNSVASFARQIGVGDQTVRSVCVQRRNKPGYDFLMRIIQTYEWLNPTWLMTGEGEMRLPNAPEDENFEKNSAEKASSDPRNEKNSAADKNFSTSTEEILRNENELLKNNIEAMRGEIDKLQNALLQLHAGYLDYLREKDKAFTDLSVQFSNMKQKYEELVETSHRQYQMLTPTCYQCAEEQLRSHGG